MKLDTLMSQVKKMIKKVIKNGGHCACSVDMHNADKYGYLGPFDKNRAQPKTRVKKDRFFR